MSPSSYAHGQFCWVDFVARDMMAAVNFYSDLFDWRVETQNTGDSYPYAMCFKNGYVVAGIMEMRDEMRENGMPPTWNSYVSVNDVVEVTELAQDLGGTIVTPPMRVGDEWLAGIQDPTGGILGLWQPGSHHGATLVNRPDSFCWNDLNTHNAGTAMRFFRELFGWGFEEDTQSKGTYYVIQNGDRGNGGLLEMTKKWDSMPTHWMVYFDVADIDRACARLESLGGKVHQGPFKTPTGEMSVVADPRGASFYLIQWTGP